MNVSGARLATGPWVMRLVLLALGVAALVGGSSYGLRTAEGLVGAGLMPALAGFVMVVASLWDGARALRDARAAVAVDAEAAAVPEAADEAGELDVFGRRAGQRNRAVLMVFAVILLAVLLSHVVGLLLALTAMVVVLLGVVEKMPWWVALVGGAAAFLFGYLVFGVALNVPLPTGMLGLV
ncbi:tripartite tricarboxylate transporter TctB family protein [Georgenia sp. EYE_87]|uniref:tripartite tricarboxylate transporter TctB family protein n=1 Tax=Georgenia sp. EYE_87 TaxID=2853448 RepID=UPI002006C872|nr:tripartite tricarboxylate transporter TctB family protein [Georgenia sp. EYE_87]MCK6210427.1 tripartite tricarboxylate transporter TctB family protein [Georgenia sp. EYE_87]